LGRWAKSAVREKLMGVDPSQSPIDPKVFARANELGRFPARPAASR
jgi:hypothetical protein